MRNSFLPDIWLCLSSCDCQSLGAKARSMQVRKTCPCLEPTGTLSPDNSRLTELSVLQTEYVLMGATQGRPEQGLDKTPLIWEFYLSNRPRCLISQAHFAPGSALKNSNPSMCLVPPEEPRSSQSIHTWACAHHWHDLSCLRSFMTNFCTPANKKPLSRHRWICSDNSTRGDLDHFFSSMLWWEYCETLRQTVWLLKPPRVFWAPVTSWSSKISAGIEFCSMSQGNS